MTEQQIDYEQAEALGISHEAYDEVLDIVGRIPTIEELSTLLAMWESNGRQQSLYGWLRGQRHTVERDEYLYSGNADHKAIKEPKVKECVEIAHNLCNKLIPNTSHPALNTGTLLYMVGNVSTEFADSEYARQCLHLVGEPMATGGHDEDCQYIELILSALQSGKLIQTSDAIGAGGLFRSALRLTAPLGYDILTPREVRLDSFLFGEEPGRYIVAISESTDDQFLLKLGEARLNCCFLGRTTKNRIMVDGYDFGPVTDYTTISK
jgi:phosphoribosylformylglycinamidine (FGAM) synthase-like enzyme